jgi:hypothetical protein
VTYHDVLPSIPTLDQLSTSPAAEDGISPNPVQRSTEQAKINRRTSWYRGYQVTFHKKENMS